MEINYCGCYSWFGSRLVGQPGKGSKFCQEDSIFDSRKIHQKIMAFLPVFSGNNVNMSTGT